jgi:hypothetical protein
MKEFDEIDDMFSQEFENFSVTPPAHVKANIDKAITKRRFPFGFWIFGGFIMVSLIFFLKTSMNSSDEKFSKTDAPLGESIPIEKNEKAQEFIKENQNAERIDGEGSTSSSNQDGFISSNYINEGTVKNQKNYSASKSIKKSTSRKKVSIKKESSSFNEESNFTNGLFIEAKEGKDDSYLNNKENSVLYDLLVQNEEIELKLKKLPYSLPSSLQISEIKNNLPLTMDPTDVQSKPWTLSLRSSILLGNSSNLIDTTQPSLIALNGFGINLELSRRIKNDFIVGSGISYQSNNIVFRTPAYVDYTYMTGEYDTTWVLDPNDPDSAFIEVLTPLYDTDSVLTSTSSVYRLNSMSLPLYFGKNFGLTNNLSLNLNGGVLISNHSFRSLSNVSIAEIEVNSWGVQGMIRPELVYDFRKWSFSTFLGIQYSFIDPFKIEAIAGSKLRFGIGLGLHYQF